MVTNDERLKRYANAMIGTVLDDEGYRRVPTVYERAERAMAVADAELAELRAELEYPDLAYAVQKGGHNLDGPTVLTDEPTGDAMRWTKDDK